MTSPMRAEYTARLHFMPSDHVLYASHNTYYNRRYEPRLLRSRRRDKLAARL